MDTGQCVYKFLKYNFYFYRISTAGYIIKNKHVGKK